MVTRLAALADLDDRALAALEEAGAEARVVRARRELLAEGGGIGAPRIIAEGWAARARTLPDGRRQLLNLLLPGDIIGIAAHPRPLAPCTVVALTEVAVCAAPPADAGEPLARAYATSHAIEEAHLLAQITRLGTMSAQERIGDFLLELLERLTLAGLAADGGFDVPLTQETLADALGLTPVHVNRVIQLMRRDGDLSWKGGRVTLHNPAGLAGSVGRVPVRVSAAT
jgi:CRP-like cAMP-binding protein